MSELFTQQNLIALLTLTALEIILGVDNVIFISILSSKLPESQQAKARQFGIALAVISRILLVFTIGYIVNNLTEPMGWALDRSVKDWILILGGLFLIAKSTHEIHAKLEGHEGHHGSEGGGKVATMKSVLIQVMIVDVIFSLDSVITAVGMVDNITIMIIAIGISATIMVLAASTIAEFIEKHPTFKILALAFLIMIGALLVFEGWDAEVAHKLHLKNYIYFAMAFSIIIEVINMKLRKSNKPVELRNNHLHK